MDFIDLKSQYRALREPINAAIQRVLDHGQYVLGPEVGELERQLAAFVGVKHCVSVASGTEALLMFAARLEHIEQVIKPALSAGKWVISDRFSDASFAYQGGGRGLDWGKLSQLEQWVHPDLQPDRTLFFDLPVEIARQRLANNTSLDRFEQEQAVFFERVRSAYLRIASENPGRVRLIDATQTPVAINKVLENIVATL